METFKTLLRHNPDPRLAFWRFWYLGPILYLPEPSSDSACLTLFEEALVPVCASGLGSSTQPLASVEESIDRGVLVAPFGRPLKTRGIYSLCLQPSAEFHPACSLIMRWFAQQAEQDAG